MVYLVSMGISFFSSAIFVLPAVIFQQYVLLKQCSLSKTAVVMVFAFYLIAVFTITGIPSVYSWDANPEFNLIPFIDIVNNPPAYILYTILNILLFMPFGFLLPVLWKEYRSLRIMALAGILLSLFIEVLQIFSFRLTDVDDLIANTTGTVLGYVISRRFAFRIPLKLPEDRKKGCGRYEPIILFGTVFLISFCLRPLLSEILWDKILSGPIWESIR